MRHAAQVRSSLALFIAPLLVLVSALVAVPVLAQAAAPAADAQSRDLAMVKPEEVGMSSEGLAALKSAMRKMVDDGELAGVLTMVARHGKTVHYDEYGKRDLATGAPIEKDTIFRIYSMTKPVVGVALMTLYEEGKFQLDDPVEKYIPVLANLKVATGDGPDGTPLVDADHPMTIRELMSHTGGLTYGIFSRTPVDLMYQNAEILDFDSTIKEMVDKLSKLPLMFQPGSRWQYSVSVDVQGYLIEVLSGKPLDQFLEERIYEPLGMTDTAFWVEPEKVSRFARLYVPDSAGQFTAQPDDEYLKKPAFLSGGGGLVSTAPDYIRFAEMLANQGEYGGARILKPETVALMRQNHLPESIPGITFFPNHQFGLDFAIVNKPDGKTESTRAKGEFYWFGVGGTWFGVHPEHDLVVLGMIQLRGGRAAGKARLLSKKLAYDALLDVAD